MADSRTIPLQLLITANDAASPEIQRLTSALDTLGIETQVIADGMAESERQAVSAFGAIADSARSSGEMIERGLVAALGRIESPQGVEELQRELQRLQQSGRLSGAELERLADAQQQLDRLAYAAGQSEAALSQELQRQKIAAQTAADAADGLGDASGRSTKAFVDHRKESGALGDALSNVADQFGLSGEAFDALTGQLAKGAAIAALATSFVNANREADLLEQQFRAMTGDATTAATEIDFLKDVANRWGVAIKDLAPAYLRLSAATKGSTAEGEKTRQMIDDLTAAYMNAGTGVDDLEEVMEILGETFAEGRVSIDDLKEGMQEDMPPAIQAATTAVLENNEALKKLLESGDAATEDFMPAFAAALREHIGGSATQIDSVSASLTRTVAALNELYVKVDSIVPLMAIFDGATKSVIKTFETVIGGASMLVDGFALVGNAVGAAAGALATGEDAIAAVTDEAERSGASIEKTALHLIGLKTASEETAIRQEQMKKELQALREETDPYGAALEALNKKLQAAAEEFEKTGDAVKLTQTALKDFMDAPQQNLNVDGVLKLAAALKTVGTQAEDSGKQVSDTLGQELAKLSSEQLTELELQARSAMAAASDGSETSRAAFAELGQVVEGVVLARLQKLGVDGPEALRGISAEADAAIADFMMLASNADLSAETIESAFAGALAKLDNPEELDTFQANIEELGKAGVLTGEQVAEALARIDDAAQKGKDGLNALEPAQRRALQASLDQADAETRLMAAQKSSLQASYDLAVAQGREADARQLLIQLAQNEANQATNNARIKNIEATAAAQVVLLLEQEAGAILASGQATDETMQKRLTSARIAAETAAIEAQAAGQVAEAERQKAAAMAVSQIEQKKWAEIADGNTKATEKNTEATEKNSKATDQAGQSYQRMEDMATHALRELSGLSTGMNNLISTMLHLDDVGQYFGHNFRSELGKLQLQLQTTNDAIEWNSHLFVVAADGFERNVIVANNARKAYLEQSIAATELAGRLRDMTDSTQLNQSALEDLATSASRSITGMRLLNEQDLDRLQSAIEAANDKLRQMQEETQSAKDRLAELNAEILEAQGEDQKAAILKQQLDYQQQLAEIERQRQDAELSGNRELLALLDEQERKLKTLNDLKIKNIQADADTARSASATESSSSSTSTSSSSRSVAKTYELKLSGGGKSIMAYTDTDPSAFLSALEAAQRVT